MTENPYDAKCAAQFMNWRYGIDDIAQSPPELIAEVVKTMDELHKKGIVRIWSGTKKTPSNIIESLLQ